MFPAESKPADPVEPSWANVTGSVAASVAAPAASAPETAPAASAAAAAPAVTAVLPALAVFDAAVGFLCLEGARLGDEIRVNTGVSGGSRGERAQGP